MANDELPDQAASDTGAATSISSKDREDDKPSWLRPLWRKHPKLITIVAIFILLQILCVVLLAIFSQRLQRTTTVDLGYAQYRGVTERSYDVNAWLGMRYAAAPVGDLRFAAPQDPVQVSGEQDASRHGKTCLSVGDKPPFNPNTDEDCLFIDVYAPSNADADSRLPVFFFIQGGGFAGNANANYNGRGLIQAAGLEMVVVNFNYRVGPYGFIAGSAIDSPNNGLKDQRKALEWVQQHISKFGGNPEHVVLGGDSAGAMSVGLHMAAYGGNETDLFHAAAMESPSFATVLNISQSEFLLDAFVSKTSCNGTSDTLSCLRSLSADDIQKANMRYPYPGAQGPPVFSWNPVIDGGFVQDLTYNSFSRGKFVKVPTLVGDDSNAGTIFAPRNVNSLADSNTFLRNTFPYLNESHMERINQLYPKDASDPFPGAGAYWRRTSNVYGDMRYMCPNMFLASAINTHGKSKGVSVWNYRYNVQDPDQIAVGLGVPHTAELGAIWGPDNLAGDSAPKSYRRGRQNGDVVPMMQGYWASFIRSLDPNTHRSEDMPEWKPWEADLNLTSTRFIIAEDAAKQRLLLDTPVNNTTMEEVDAGVWDRCEYFWSIGIDLRQ